MDESVMNLGLSNQSDFLTSTSGFLITDDSGQEKVQTAWKEPKVSYYFNRHY